MSKRRNPFPGVGNQPTLDRHGCKRWRLRKTVKGRKIDTYLPGPYGSAEFRAAYDAADNPAPVTKTAGSYGTYDHVITDYRGNKKFKELAKSTRYGKGLRLDWIRQIIGKARLADIEPYHIESIMDRKGGPNAANRLLKATIRTFRSCAQKNGHELS